jgi:hypothetical protein
MNRRGLTLGLDKIKEKAMNLRLMKLAAILLVLTALLAGDRQAQRESVAQGETSVSIEQLCNLYNFGWPQVPGYMVPEVCQPFMTIPSDLPVKAHTAQLADNSNWNLIWIKNIILLGLKLDPAGL